MSKTTDPFAPAMQQFAQAGQAMAQQFFSFLGSPAAQHPLGGSPIQMGAPDPEKLSALQQNFIQQQSQLWNAMLARGKVETLRFARRAARRLLVSIEAEDETAF